MPIDKGFAHTVQGTYEPSVYLLDVMLPNGMVVKNRHVSDGDFDDCDVLIRSGRLSTGQPGVRDVRGAQANPPCVRESAYDASCETSPKIQSKSGIRWSRYVGNLRISAERSSPTKSVLTDEYIFEN